MPILVVRRPKVVESLRLPRVGHAGKGGRALKMRRIILLFLGIMVVGGVAVAALALTGVGASTGDLALCRPGDVLDGVHHPNRLKVIDPCVTARGTVAVVQDHEDGDWHIGVVPDPYDLDLLGRENVTKLGGLLVVEVIPQDQRTVKRPRAGSRIQVTGAYVIDTPYGWREIHPVWNVQEISPSPLPEGTGQQLRDLGRQARRLLLRLRAEIRERLG